MILIIFSHDQSKQIYYLFVNMFSQSINIVVLILLFSSSIVMGVKKKTQFIPYTPNRKRVKKRKPNCFLLYRQWLASEQSHITASTASFRWNRLSEEEKNIWRDRYVQNAQNDQKWGQFVVRF
jgi:hypothetical protein